MEGEINYNYNYNYNTNFIQFTLNEHLTLFYNINFAQ